MDERRQRSGEGDRVMPKETQREIERDTDRY